MTFFLMIYRAPLIRVALTVAVVIVGVSLFLTGSRWDIATAVTCVAVAFLAGPVRARALAAVLAVAAIGITYFVLVAPPQVLGRFTSFTAGGGSGRMNLPQSVAVEMWRHNKVGGVGTGNFTAVEARYAVGNIDISATPLVVDEPHVAHNTYLHVLTEEGVIGLGFFLLLLTAVLRAAWQAVKNAQRAALLRLELLARGLTIGTLGLLAADFFLTAQYEKQLWLILSLCLAVAAIARRAESERLAVEPVLVEAGPPDVPHWGASP